MNTRLIRQGIEEAQRELAEIRSKLADMESLERRRVMLEAYITSADSLLNGNRKTERPQESREEQRASKPNEPPTDSVWVGAQTVLSEQQRPMSVAAICQELTKMGYKISKDWGREVVRAALFRKKDLFERVAPGMYALRQWPEAMKKAL